MGKMGCDKSDPNDLQPIYEYRKMLNKVNGGIPEYRIF